MSALSAFQKRSTTICVRQTTLLVLVPLQNTLLPLFLLTLAAIGFCSFDFKGTRITKKGNIKEAVGSTKVVMVSFTAILVLIVGLIIGGLASSQLFRASKYAGIIKVEDGDFATDVPESENINNIALMDTDSARIIGDRSIGSLSDVVSQYQVSETYSTID